MKEQFFALRVCVDRTRRAGFCWNWWREPSISITQIVEICYAYVLHYSRNLVMVLALAVLWIFAESGGALTVIAAGVFAGAIVSLGLEPVLKILEEIRDRAAGLPSTLSGREIKFEAREREVGAPTAAGAVPV
jgi:hypothetical protein